MHKYVPKKKKYQMKYGEMLNVVKLERMEDNIYSE